jgi:hypothetical protein
VLCWHSQRFQTPLADWFEMSVFVIECGVGSVIINGFNQPLVFFSEQSAQAHIEQVVFENEGNPRNASLRVVECYRPEPGRQSDFDVSLYGAGD